MRFCTNSFRVAALAVFAWLSVSVAQAQMDAVIVSVQPQDIGLAGAFRPGSWTAMRVTLDNRSSKPARRVMVEWSLPDIDGDIVQARRIATLRPQELQSLWLYAVPRLNTRPNNEWRIRVIDVDPNATAQSEAGQLRDSARVLVPESVAHQDRVVGVIGSANLALDAYNEALTVQESTRVVRGLTPESLPDRWYGLSILETLIWTPEGGDPGAMPDGPRQALRQWVMRGGHLVLVIPAAGDLWSTSPMRDMLPVAGSQIKRVDEVSAIALPSWLGMPIREGDARFSFRWFDVEPQGTKPGAAGFSAGTSVLLRDREGRPMVVAGQFGLGRVTMIGVDLTDPRLRALHLPSSVTGSANPGGVMLWPTVLGWRGPIFSKAATESLLNTGRIARPGHYRSTVELSRNVIPSAVAMTEAAGPAMLLAVVTFVIYWVLAGPVSFLVLKGRGMVRHAWTGFLAVVLVFTAVAWSGALVLRPSNQRAAHISVLDMDAASGLVRAHSWLALFVPRHGLAEVSLDPAYTLGGTGGTHNTLWSPGVELTLESGAFADEQRYAMDAGDPGSLAVPIRATAKQFEADYLFKPNAAGVTTGRADQQVKAWPMPRGKIRLINGKPVGEVTHQFAAPMRDVLVVYCPGDGKEPIVWRPRFVTTPGANVGSSAQWPAGVPLVINDVQGQTLAIAPRDQMSDEPSQRVWGGHLGDLLNKHLFTAQMPGMPAQQITLSDDRRISTLEMLSFFSSLPPPDFRYTNVPGPTQYQRLLGREFDLTPMLAMRRLIVIGHVNARENQDVPLPLPLLVDGRPVAASGWTVVRWIAPVE